MADSWLDTMPLGSKPTIAAPFQAPDFLHILETRRSVKPPGLSEPGPTSAELHRILTVASRVPDHGLLVPWRFILFEGEARMTVSVQLASVWAAHNLDAEPARRQQMVDKLSQYFIHAPLIVLVVSRADPSAPKPEWEQVLTVGAVCMNLITAATALGYAAVWLTGWAAYDESARNILGVASQEKVAGIIHLGTATACPTDRRRPILDDLVTRWGTDTCRKFSCVGDSGYDPPL